ncbi:MAG: hypothetical protein ACYDH9_09690 [Limisphaerales bacterium]
MPKDLPKFEPITRRNELKLVLSDMKIERFKITESRNLSGAVVYRVAGRVSNRKRIRQNFPTIGLIKRRRVAHRPEVAGFSRLRLVRRSFAHLNGKNGDSFKGAL